MFRTAFPQGASRRLIAAFVLLLLLPAVAVVWLGVRLIAQDRQIESDRLRKARDRAAEQIVKVLNERLYAAERSLGSVEPPADDAVTLVLGTDGVETRPAKRLLYRPGLAVGISDALPAFVPGEELEYRRRDLNAAEAAYRRLTVDRSPDIRAGASYDSRACSGSRDVLSMRFVSTTTSHACGARAWTVYRRRL